MGYFKNKKIARLLKKASKQGLNTAIATYNKIIKIDSELPSVYNYIGLCYFELTDYENAEKYFKLAIEKFNDDFKSQYEVYYNLGFTYQSMNNFSEAEKCYKKSMNLNDDYRFTYKNYGYLLFQNKEYKKSLNMFEKYNSFIEEAEVYNNIGIIYEEMGKKKLAIEAYEKSILTDKTYALAYNNLGVLYLNDKKYGDAGKLFDNAIKYDSSFVDAYNNYASVLVIDKQYNSALDLYRRALKINPNNSVVLVNTAKLYSYLNDINNLILILKKLVDKGMEISKIIEIEEFKNIENIEDLLRKNL